MSDKPFAYVCSPLRGDVEANMARAREYSRQVFEAGYCPITPHIYFPQFLKDEIQTEREAGMAMGESLLPLCRVLVICGDTISEGMKREIQAAQGLGIETCALENIPQIPALSNYRDDLTGLENLNIAASLIEGMTGARFRYVLGDSYIHPDGDSYFAVNKLVSFSRDDMLFRVRFSASLKKMGVPMSANDMVALQQETDRVHALMDALESLEYTLTPEEMNEFNNAIRQRGEPMANVEKPSVLERIAADRAERAAAPERGTPEKQHKSRGEEL